MNIQTQMNINDYRIADNPGFQLTEIRTSVEEDLISKKKGKKLRSENIEQMILLQDKLYAQDKYSILLVFLIPLAVLEPKIAIDLKPAVKIDTTAKGVESVVRDNRQHTIFPLAFGKCSAYQSIHPLIQLCNYVALCLPGPVPLGRMLLVNIPPKSVLKPVGPVENANTQAVPDLIQSVKKHLFAFAVHLNTLLYKTFVDQDLLVQRPTVFSQA